MTTKNELEPPVLSQSEWWVAKLLALITAFIVMFLLMLRH